MKKLVGRTDTEDALKRLDKLTQEEAQMAVAQNLKAMHTVDERVMGVADTVVAVDNRVAGIDDRVTHVGDKVASINDRVASVDDKVKGIDNRVAGDAAADYGRLEVVRVLIEDGASIDAEDNKGRTPFQIASAKGRGEIMNLLSEHGAN